MKNKEMWNIVKDIFDREFSLGGSLKDKLNAEQIQFMLKIVKANYKYTQPTDKFIRKAFGSNMYLLSTFHSGQLNKEIINPTKDFKLIIGTGVCAPVQNMRIIENDFELTDMDGKLDVELSRQWREGMVKSALPRHDEKKGIDVHHYMGEWESYEKNKFANEYNNLGKLDAFRREKEEQK